jgi:hypothetical protein
MLQIKASRRRCFEACDCRGWELYLQTNCSDQKKRLIGVLTLENGEYSVIAEGKTYKVLQASVTYYKGQGGDRVTIIVPKDSDSGWAAFEGVIHDHGTSQSQEDILQNESGKDEVIQPKVASDQSFDSEPIVEPEIEPEPAKVATPEEVIAEEANTVPPENAEALKVIHESLGAEESAVTSDETQNNVAGVNQILAQEAENSSEPQIIKHATEMPEGDELVEQENESNAMGDEQSEKRKEQSVEELEI